MFDVALFFGVPVTQEVQIGLNRANPNALPIFINNDSEYLHECTVKGTRYLGKYVEAPAGIETFEMVAVNVESLLRKLIPEFSRMQHPLCALATAKQPAATAHTDS